MEYILQDLELKCHYSLFYRENEPSRALSLCLELEQRTTFAIQISVSEA